MEDSAGRMNRAKTATAATALSPGSALVKAASPLPTAVAAAEGQPQPCDSPSLPLPAEQDQQYKQRPHSMAPSKLHTDARGSASTEKMGHIMRLIEQLEKQAVEEARQVAPAQLQFVSTGVADQSAAAAAAAEPAVHPTALMLAVQPHNLGSKKMLAAAESDATAAQAVRFAASSRVARKAEQLLQASIMKSSGQRGTASVASGIQAAAEQQGEALVAQPLQGEQPQIDAVAVASSVRAKIQQLQAAVAEKDSQLATLQQRILAVQSQHEAAMRAAEDGHRVGTQQQCHFGCEPRIARLL